MTIELAPLPYPGNALAPHLSAETLEIHHGRHHRSYVDAVNRLAPGKGIDASDLSKLVLRYDGNLFNAAAQVWNHDFYWRSMAPGGGGPPTGRVAERITNDFGSYDAFRLAFKTAAVAQFGSGWVWLVEEGRRLRVTTTSNADLPMKHGQRALLTCDVWEHAYYVDYRNERARYVDVFLDHLVNWDWAARNAS